MVRVGALKDGEVGGGPLPEGLAANRAYSPPRPSILKFSFQFRGVRLRLHLKTEERPLGVLVNRVVVGDFKGHT